MEFEGAMVAYVLGIITETSELLVLVRSTAKSVNNRVTGDPRLSVEMEIKKTFEFCHQLK